MKAQGELKRLLEVRVPELIAYQNEAYARRYLEDVKRVRGGRASPSALDSSDLSEAFARYLFKLMAYKDEYEVARLSLKREVNDGAGGAIRRAREDAAITCSRPF